MKSQAHYRLALRVGDGDGERRTEQYDRGEKLRQYQRIVTPAHVVLVAHDEKRIDVWSNEGGQWTVATASSGERAVLDGIRCSLEWTTCIGIRSTVSGAVTTPGDPVAVRMLR